MPKLGLRKTVAVMILLSLSLILCYQFVLVEPTIFEFTMRIRAPKALAMLIAAFCIGTASIVFQSIIQNRIVTPCLLGMNSLYVLMHTVVMFFLGISNPIVANQSVMFLLDLLVMGTVATLIYGVLFKKTNYNILYILLAGTVLATLFGSISDSLVRVMDPNEFASLLESLVAGFNNINEELFLLAGFLIILTIIIFYKDIRLLDVITLGRTQAINLGVDYDKTVTRLLVAVTIFIAIATALVGPISFLGLIVANLSREIFKTYKHSYLMLGSFLSGVIVLFFGQTLIEHVFGFGVLISVFIDVLGGGYFLYLILRSGQKA